MQSTDGRDCGSWLLPTRHEFSRYASASELSSADIPCTRAVAHCRGIGHAAPLATTGATSAALHPSRFNRDEGRLTRRSIQFCRDEDLNSLSETQLNRITRFLALSRTQLR